MSSRRKVIVTGALVVIAAIAIVLWRTRGDDARPDGGAGTDPHVTGSGGTNGLELGRRDDRRPATKRPGRQIEGVVVSEDGAPVRGASVRIGNVHAQRSERSVSTDDAGRFVLGERGVDRYVVTAERAGLTAASKELDLRDPTLRTDELRLVLYPCTASIHGAIRDSGGGVIEGAIVQRSVGMIGAGGGAVSSAQGAYELCLPPGDSFVTVHADGYAMVFDRASAFGKTRRDFTLSPGASVAGRIVRAGSGDPVEGTVVAVTGTDRTRLPVPIYGVADEQGHFQIDGLGPGPHEITATGPGVATARPCEAEAQIGTIVEIVCEVSATLTISGTLVERGGKPLAGVMVRMVPTTRDAIKAIEYDRTQNDGTFAIDHLPPGEYRPFVEDSDQEFPSIKLEAKDVSGVVLEVDRHGSIAGRVLYGGKPVAEASVQLQKLGRAETTDESGAFVFHGIPAGTYQVYAESHRVGAFTPGPKIALGANEQRTGVDVVLDLSGSIEGVVVDQNDRPVPGVYLAFSLLGGRDFGLATTADDGTFRARALSGGGEYSVEIRNGPGSGVAFAPATGKRFPRFAVNDGATHLTGVRLQIRWERLVIAGRVSDASGQPAPDVTVEAVPKNGTWMRAPSATSDQSGAFSIRDLPAGTYGVRADGPGGTTVVDGIAAGRTDVVLRLATPGGLDGTLVGFTDPVEVIAYAMDRGRQYRATVTGTSFRIAQLPAGQYLARAISKSGGGMQQIEVQTGKRATLTFKNLGVGTIAGTVRDEKTGAPVAGMMCWIQGQSPDRRMPPKTDNSGAFRIEGAPGGTQDLTCYGQQRYASKEITVPSGGVVTVELATRDMRPKGTSTAGLVLDVQQNEVVVAAVAAGGPGAKAGVKIGDVLTAIDNQKVGSSAAMAENILARRGAGTKVKLALERDDKELTLEVTLDVQPEGSD